MSPFTRAPLGTPEYTPAPDNKGEDAAANAAADAWEAAQRILKTFEGFVPPAEDVGARGALQEQLALLARQMADVAQGEGVEEDVEGEMRAGWSVKEEDVDMSSVLRGEGG